MNSQSPGSTKSRLDALLVERGLAQSGSRARAIIEAGLVYLDGIRLDKPGRRMALDTALELRGDDHPWVSRGGLKLDHALTQFAVDPRHRICLDLGASTGGFSDVLLSRGAAIVHAVDVGRDQLADKIRQDPRVVVHESFNARALDRARIPDPISLLVCDLSFIGLRTALPAGIALTAPAADLIALIKPQFEVGPGGLGKGGVVRDAGLRQAACARIRQWLDELPNWRAGALIDSPVTGSDGNLEYFIHARRLDDG